MAVKNPIICKRCNIPMNPHAEKEDRITGKIMEIHTCPGCGSIQTRPEE